MDKIQNMYELWINNDFLDKELKKELENIKDDKDAISERFYKELEFGTGGLRGILGAGTNRMNVYTVAKATRGYAKYLKRQNSNPSIAIAYDSRNKSDVFSKVVAGTMVSMGVKVFIWKELMPTPSLSFAIRYLKCDGGIVITASHNPSKYNGYKVYGNDGCQITNKGADEILSLIGDSDIFKDFDVYEYDKAIKENKIEIISDKVFDSYIDAVSSQSLLSKDIDRNVRIAYTPLYGTGLKCVKTVLNKNGFNNIVIVEEQSKPNGDFPTCPYPNPEFREALEVGLQVASKEQADILMATDPDSDRLGIAVRYNGDYKLISGNEVGMLLLDYICKERIRQNKMPKNPIFVKTIVSIDMADRIAQKYGVKTIDVLTGFKFIGEQIAILEERGEEDSYIFGYEESYGYLSGSYVRDKDAVSASLLVAEIFAYYKSKGKTLVDVLNDLYDEYGYCLNTLHCFQFEGQSGMKKMNDIMDFIRNNTPIKFSDKQVLEVRDYLTSEIYNIQTKVKSSIDLPKSNVIKIILEGNSSIIFRPSGTEPKLKVYISVSDKNKEIAMGIEEKIAKIANDIIN